MIEILSVLMLPVLIIYAVLAYNRRTIGKQTTVVQSTRTTWIFAIGIIWLIAFIPAAYVSFGFLMMMFVIDGIPASDLGSTLIVYGFIVLPLFCLAGGVGGIQFSQTLNSSERVRAAHWFVLVPFIFIILFISVMVWTILIERRGTSHELSSQLMYDSPRLAV